MNFVEYVKPSKLILCALAALAIKLVLFAHGYIKARRQFPGPPVASIWSGNLAETMTEDVHERWRRWHREFGPVYQTVRSLFPLPSTSTDETTSGTAYFHESFTLETRISSRR